MVKWGWRTGCRWLSVLSSATLSCLYTGKEGEVGLFEAREEQLRAKIEYRVDPGGGSTGISTFDAYRCPVGLSAKYPFALNLGGFGGKLV